MPELYVYYAAGAALVVTAAGVAYYLATKTTEILTPAKYTAFPLASKVAPTHNTLLLTFALPRPTDVLPLPTGTHMTLHDPSTSTSRPYTPIPSPTPGIFTLLVKVYPAGKMSQHLDKMQVGETVLARGPSGRFDYEGQIDELDVVGMVAGGTGITPMWSVITRILADTERPSKPKIRLVYGNVKEEDILLRNEMEEAMSSSGGRFEVYFVLNEEPAGGQWKGGLGFVTKDMIESVVGSRDTALRQKVYLCGPPPMNKAMRGHLESLGYGDADIFKF